MPLRCIASMAVPHTYWYTSTCTAGHTDQSAEVTDFLARYVGMLTDNKKQDGVNTMAAFLGALEALATPSGNFDADVDGAGCFAGAYFRNALRFAAKWTRGKARCMSINKGEMQLNKTKLDRWFAWVAEQRNRGLTELQGKVCPPRPSSCPVTNFPPVYVIKI